MDAGEYVIYEGHPSWRGIMSFYLRGLLIAIVAGLVAAGASAAFDDGVNAGWVTAAVVVVLAVVILVGLVKRIATTYTVTSERLRIRHGLLSKSVQETRLHRVQNVNTHQSPVDRLLQVGKVEFDTAGTDDYEFAFVGIADPHGIAEKVDRAAHAVGEPTEPVEKPRQA
jgi:uncharacterized membrane protein YdbT with pleckstrin-like domain